MCQCSNKFEEKNNSLDFVNVGMEIHMQSH